MARKKRIKIENCRPGYSAKPRTLSRNGVSIPNVIKNVYNEVGKSEYSEFPGVDPNGTAIRAITYGQKDPLMFRYEYISDYEESELEEISSVLSSNYYYEHDKRPVNKGKKQVFRYEKKCRPYITYEEEYFQHIFNWPTSHTMKPRTVGAFIDSVDSCTGIVTTFKHVDEYPGGEMTLDKTVSQLYYIDDNWEYQPLNLNADGTIQDASGDITDRIGEPVIYHGGTDDNCIFFHYVTDLVDTDSVSTKDLIVVGDTVNGATITNIVNYVVDVTLKRTATKSPPKGTVDVDTDAARFIALGYTQADFNATKSWLKLNTAEGIAKGNAVWGKGIREGTVVTAIDEARNRVYLSETLSSKKIKIVRFLDSTINRVNKNTLCYATISGGTFTADTNYTVSRGGSSTGITICVRAGKGIINRSAIVGTYFSKNKKEIEYLPIFYSADPNCQKEILEDDNGEYVLGSVIWNDNSRLEGKYLLTKPKTVDAYRIASIYNSFTYALIDKETLEMFLSQYGDDNGNIGYLQVYNAISSYAKTELGNKKAAACYDDICRDQLSLEYILAYDPSLELNNVLTSVDGVGEAIRDDCVIDPPFGLDFQEIPTTIESVKDKLKSLINSSVENSTFMTKDYYDRLVVNDDSLLNRITSATETVKKSVPTKTKVDNLPPKIEGQDESGVRWIAKNYRDLPPAMDRVKFFATDVIVGTDKDLDPTLDLDPATTVNQPKIIIRSRPRWIWNGPTSWPTTKTHSDGCGSFTSTFTVNASSSEGYLDKIVTSSLSNNSSYTQSDFENDFEDFNSSLLIPFILDPEFQFEDMTVGTGINPPVAIKSCPTDPPTIGYCTRSWSAPSPKDGDDNIIFGEKAEPWNFSNLSADQTGYISATNWGLHPNLRDLDNKDRSDDSDIAAPDVAAYPKTLWAPNISYQMDYHKMFHFRIEELSELLGETIQNSGNPYLDFPIRAKITKTIQPADTTIHVQSTEGFLSSGYLIIPKYTKKLLTTETGNVNSYFTYCGEEIIYYKSKTSTTFQNCERKLFGSTSDFEITLPAHSMEQNVRYRIESLGTTNWESVGAGKDARVGTVFVATKTGDGDGTVQIFGTNSSETASENLEVYEDPPKIPVISSYETGFSVSQHWIFTLKED